MVFNRKQSRALGSGAALAAVALAACAGGGGSPSPTASASPVATVTPIANTSAGPGLAAIGVAYLPDGGNGQGFTGLQIVHFEDTNAHLLASSLTSSPLPVLFGGAVGPFEISSDGVSALAAVSKDTTPNYTLVESVFGTNSSGTVPVGPGYDVTELATPNPNATPTPAGATPTPVPSPLPVLSAVTSLGIYGTASSSEAVGVVAGPDTTGFLGLTQLLNAGPTYGGFVPFESQTPAPILAARPHVAVLAASNVSVALLRGASDLIAYHVNVGGTGYTFTLGGQNTTLGLSSTQYGNGVMAIDPHDGGRALIGQTNPGDGTPNGVTLISGLPTAITVAATISVGSTPRSIAIGSAGQYAVVGTDQGFVVIGGLTTGSLVLEPSFLPAGGTVNSPPYVGCDGVTRNLVNVSSIGFSADLGYLALLGNAPSANCAGGRTASVIAIPFNQETGTAPTPAPSPTASATVPPTIFVQNNVIAPSAGQDYMFVR